MRNDWNSHFLESDFVGGRQPNVTAPRHIDITSVGNPTRLLTGHIGSHAQKRPLALATHEYENDNSAMWFPRPFDRTDCNN
jgi:hypothetical protein